MLATTEAVANAIEHGEPCDPLGIYLRLETGDGTIMDKLEIVPSSGVTRVRFEKRLATG